MTNYTLTLEKMHRQAALLYSMYNILEYKLGWMMENTYPDSMNMNHNNGQNSNVMMWHLTDQIK